MRLFTVNKTHRKLNPKAKRLLERYLKQYEQALLTIASALARQKGDEAILCNHILRAAHNISHQGDKRSRIKQLMVAIGGALFGVFLQGFIIELEAGRPLFITIYTIMGFVGFTMILLGQYN